MMWNRWIGVALLTSCLSQPTAAWAQKWSCGEVGPSVPGPLASEAAPRVPLDELGLPVCIPNAFDNPPCPPCSPCEVYVYLGGMALQREPAGRAPLVLLNPGIVVSQFDDVLPNMAAGPRATVGIRQGYNSWELSAFWIPESEADDQVVSNGQLGTFFINPPAGFVAAVNPWQGANMIRTTLRDSLLNVELNCRRTVRPYLECLAGVRFVELAEHVRIFADHDIPPTNPAHFATYTTRTFDRMVLAQLGFEWERFVPCLWDVVAAGCSAKGAWGANWVRADENLVRGDGFPGLANRHTSRHFAHLYDATIFVDIIPAERLRVRMGYQFLWFPNPVLAANNLDFDLGNLFTGNRNDQPAFFHGPHLELQLLF